MFVTNNHWRCTRLICIFQCSDGSLFNNDVMIIMYYYLHLITNKVRLNMKIQLPSLYMYMYLQCMVRNLRTTVCTCIYTLMSGCYVYRCAYRSETEIYCILHVESFMDIMISSTQDQNWHQCTCSKRDSKRWNYSQLLAFTL